MNDDRLFERTTRSWIELGPTDPPAHVVDRALRTIETTPQVRNLHLPWRGPKVGIPQWFAAAVIALLTIGGGVVLVGGAHPPIAHPGPAAVPSISPSPAADVVPDYSSITGWIVFEGFDPLVAPVASAAPSASLGGQIWLVKADGSGLHELAPGTPIDGKTSLDISPDGLTVAFSTLSPLRRIWQVPIEGGIPERLTAGCSGRPADCTESDPAYSPDGTHIAFVHVDGDGSHLSDSSVVGVRDLTTGDVRLLEATRGPLGAPGVQAWLSQPAWSPDGSRIAYNRSSKWNPSPPFARMRIDIIGADGTGLVELPLPVGQLDAHDPDWSPDGSLIVFSNTTAAPHIYTIRPNGSDTVQVCDVCLGAGYAPVWTPDGKHILFWWGRTWALMDPDGGRQAPINADALTFPGNPSLGAYPARLQPVP
jgi:Tol biopolymer transport system component